MYAQPANIEALEQVPVPSMERVVQAPGTSSPQGAELMSEGFAIQRNPRPLARISFNQPADGVSPGLRRAVDSAVDNAFGRDNGPEATASANQPMKPEGVMRGIEHIFAIRSGGGNLNRNIIHLIKAGLTDDKISFNGACNAKNRGNSWIAKTITDQGGKLVSDYCYQKDYTYRHDPVDYSPYLQSLGSKAAASVGLGPTTHGDATRIAATKKQAKINFAQNPNADSATRELRSLTLRRGKTPLRTFY